MNRTRFRDSAGFTLLEMVVVIVLIAVLSVVAIARLTAVDSFEVEGFFDSVKATVRFAQKVAVAQRTDVVVVVNATSISVCYSNPACATPVTDPTSGGAMTLSAPAGVTIAGPGVVSFDGLGRANPGGTISVTGAGTVRNLEVEAETGYVHG